jgi:primosomal protein N' (replication factor Y)
MREEFLAGNPGALSRPLANALEAAVAAGRQAIVLLNRRGYHRVALCRSCGKAVKCGECSVPMVYHKARGAGGLLCHYCGRVQSPAPQTCPECGGALRYAGFGTQRLEDELAERLPNARILRMDMDTTARKGAHTDMLARFAAGQYDIMVGTQMVAKGLDFERVGLVGVVGIDSLLLGQGYRAYENVFSLVTQVVGRSGRARLEGEGPAATADEAGWPEAGMAGAVPEAGTASEAGAGPVGGGPAGTAMIQTIEPRSPVLALAAKQDYEAFYEQEIAFRKLALYPPFCALCVAGFVAEEERKAIAAARRFAALLAGRAAEKPDIPLRVLGPAPMPVLQVAGAYRYRLTLKCRGDAAFRSLVRQVLDDYNKEGLPRAATLWLDFNPEQ